MKYLIIFLLVLTAVWSQTINKNIVFKNVDRTIDLSTQLVKITNTITVKNVGSEIVKSMVWVIEEEAAEKISFFGVKDASKRDLKFVEMKENGRDGKYYNINLTQGIVQGKHLVIIIDEVYSRTLLPHPPSITQKERQLVLYNGNHYIFSAYLVQTQTTKVSLKSKGIESYSKKKPVVYSDGLVIYGPYESIPAYSIDKMVVHFENNSPFLSVTELYRHIEVSHWGSIAIEEKISLLHTGAKLKGSFSRYEFQRDGNSGLNAVKSFKTLLPASADKPYYRDHNGNVSTSNMRFRKDSVELDLRPRFPLFGGWKTVYTLGYNVPSYQYLYHTGDSFLLKIRAIDHVFDDMHIDRLVTKVVLPVAAQDIKLKTPYPVERLPDTWTYKYLDTKGRIVVTFCKENLVENHIQEFELKYQWSYALMFHEPILIIIAMYLMFLCVIIYVRLDFSLQNNEVKDYKKEN